MILRSALPTLCASLLLFGLTGCGKSDDANGLAGGPEGTAPGFSGPVMLSIRIQEDLLPAEREQKYDIPLNNALKEAGLGNTTRSGAVYNQDWRVDHIVIEATVNDVAKGVSLLRKKLRELEAPKSSVIEQSVPYRHVYRVYDI